MLHYLQLDRGILHFAWKKGGGKINKYPTLIINTPPYSTLLHNLNLFSPTSGQRPGRTGHHHSTHPVTLLKSNLVHPNTSMQLPPQPLLSAVQLRTVAVNAKSQSYTSIYHSLIAISLCTGTDLLLIRILSGSLPLTQLPILSSLPQHMTTSALL